MAGDVHGHQVRGLEGLVRRGCHLQGAHLKRHVIIIPSSSSDLRHIILPPSSPHRRPSFAASSRHRILTSSLAGTFAGRPELLHGRRHCGRDHGGGGGVAALQAVRRKDARTREGREGDVKGGLMSQCGVEQESVWVLVEGALREAQGGVRQRAHPVSYTHLTLPTICSV
eukprot:1735368-Rhodomonas_salina.1